MTTMQEVTFIGYTLDEYQHMFDLNDDDLNLKIIDCAAGPASFNAELTHRGGQVKSCDPLYELPRSVIEERVNMRCDSLMKGLEFHKNKFNWQRYPSPTNYLDQHKQAIKQFYNDYVKGLEQKRYCTGLLPHIPFGKFEFDIALCSHFLFSKHYHHSLDFVLTSVLEMCRVAHEARIFPLLDPNGGISQIVAPLAMELQQRAFGVEIRQVPYEFQKGGNAMLRVWATECSVTRV